MESVECLKYAAFITHLDIWALGALSGGLLVVIARWLEGYLNLRFSVRQKEMDLILGEALKGMRKELEELEDFKSIVK